MKTRTPATRILARTAVVALLAVSAAFFAGCGKKDEGGDSADKKEAVEKGKEDFQKGLEACKEKKFDDAVNSFEKAVKAGNTDAMILLGNCYYTEKGVEEDKVKAKELIKKAADAGNVKAKFFVLLLDAEDGKIEIGEAFEKMKKLDAELLKLAEANDPLAQVTYISFCQLRVDMEGSPEAKAKASEDLDKWYEKAKETGADKLL